MARQPLDRSDHQLLVIEGIAAAGAAGGLIHFQRLAALFVVDRERQIEAPQQLDEPLVDQAFRQQDQDPAGATAGDELRGDQARLRWSCPGRLRRRAAGLEFAARRRLRPRAIDAGSGRCARRVRPTPDWRAPWRGARAFPGAVRSDRCDPADPRAAARRPARPVARRPVRLRRSTASRSDSGPVRLRLRNARRSLPTPSICTRSPGRKAARSKRRAADRVVAQHARTGEYDLDLASRQSQHGAQAQLGFRAAEPALSWTKFEHVSARWPTDPFRPWPSAARPCTRRFSRRPAGCSRGR